MNVEKVMQRSKRYWYEDGLGELAVGVVFLLIAALFALEAAAPHGSPLAGISALGLPVIVILGVLVINRLVKTAKERITFPRTGYVSYPRRKGSRKVAAGGVGGMAGVIAFFFVTAPGTTAWIPLFQGIFIAAFFTYIGYSISLFRFFLLAAVSLVTGVGASVLAQESGDLAGTALYFAVLGTAFIASGAIVLIRYLGKTKPVES